MSSIDVIFRKTRQYARKQNAVDLISVMLVTCAAVLIALSTALALLRSPWYGLIGLAPLCFIRWPSILDRARELERKAGLKQEIVASIQLARIPQDNKERYSRDLIEGFVDAAASRVETMDTGKYVGHAGLAKAGRFLLVALCLSLIHPAFFAERFWYSLYHEIGYRILPGNAELPMDTGTEIMFEAWGVYVPQWVEMSRRSGDGHVRQRLRLRGGVALASVTVSGPIAYSFRILDHETEKYEVRPIEPLRIEHLAFLLTYPAHTGLAPDTVLGRQIVAPSRTRVRIEGRASGPLNSAVLEYVDTLSLQCQGRDFHGDFTVKESGDATLSLSARSVLAEPIRIYSIPDLDPLVDIFYPGTDIDLPREMALDVGIRCSDDYGLSSAAFLYTVDPESAGFSMPIAVRGFEDTVIFNWDLSGMGMLPGDEVSYHVVVRDNSGNSAKSAVFHVRFPTMEQMYEDVSEKKSMLQSDIDQMQSEHGEYTKETERLYEKMMEERALSWADQEKLTEALEKEGAILDRVKEWQAELEQTIEELRDNVMLDERSIERLNEISRILEEIAPEELRQALEQMRVAMDQRPKDMEKALEQLRFRQEELARALERTLEILKRFEQEERLKQLAEQARQLAEEQSSLADGAQAEEEIDAQRQEAVDQSMEELAKDLADLASSQGLEGDIQEGLQQMAMDLKAMSNAGPKEKKSGLQQMAMSLQQMYDKLTKGRAANLRKNLLFTLEQIIEASKEQERLVGQGSGMDARAQEELMRSIEAIAESLFAQQSKSFFVSPQIGKRLARATLRMGEAQKAQSNNDLSRQKATEAMAELNLAARDILLAMQRMSEQGSSTGMQSFMQQLANIAQGQMSISQSLFNILPIPAQGLSPGQRQQLERLAGRQRALRDALESLKGEPAAGQFQDVLENMIDEMKEMEEELFQYKVSRELIERQKKVISRLLDSQRSIRKEDFTQKRESKPGQDILDRMSPAGLKPELGRDELRELLQKELRKPLPREYEIYIREYFKSLLEEK